MPWALFASSRGGDPSWRRDEYVLSLRAIEVSRWTDNMSIWTYIQFHNRMSTRRCEPDRGDHRSQAGRVRRQDRLGGIGRRGRYATILTASGASSTIVASPGWPRGLLGPPVRYKTGPSSPRRGCPGCFLRWATAGGATL
jgi:hypothetical protein